MSWRLYVSDECPRKEGSEYVQICTSPSCVKSSFKVLAAAVGCPLCKIEEWVHGRVLSSGGGVSVVQNRGMGTR